MLDFVRLTKTQRMIARLACLLVLASNISAAEDEEPAPGEYVYAEPSDVIRPYFREEEINSTYAMFAVMAQALELSFTGIYNLTEFLTPMDIGMAQDIVRRCEKRSELPACDELDPIEMKRIRAAAESGKSSADLAQMLGNAADGAMGAGQLLEIGIAEKLGISPTRVGGRAASIADDTYLRTEREARCHAAGYVSNARAGEEGRREMAESYFSPIAMMTEASCMLLVASNDLSDAQGRERYEAESLSRDTMSEVIDQIRFEGAEQLGSGPAYRLSLDTPGMTESIDDSGQQYFHVDRIERWIHAELLTETKTRISGRITTEPDPVNRARIRRGETRSVYMEKEMGDFRWLPGTRMYHPFRMTTRVGGLLSEEELEEMSEAAESLDEIEAQMAAMPPRERQRMQQMMGPRIEKLRNMVDSGVFEFTLITKRVLVNTDAGEALSGKVGYEPKLLIQEIQSNLNILGYYLDAFDGELSSKTISAIIRYQRDYQLELTGRPTPELARIISATLSAVR